MLAEVVEPWPLCSGAASRCLDGSTTIAAMSIVESARSDWSDGYRRFLEVAAEPARGRACGTGSSRS